ncbi:MAG: DEAD/DEAH box helicase [Planctomycetaceae bacterium]|jgi:non-specific serine/threonine protein kinase|nr:DEAD/DEAH box helicase [Planctomycetaceae bacterium]
MQLRISPAGHPIIESDDDNLAAVTPIEKRVLAAFVGDGGGYPRVLLHLATVELNSVLSAEFDFLRSFGKNYITRLCHLPELASAGDKLITDIPAVSPPSAADFEFSLMNVPPIVGCEYLTADALSEWWIELDSLVHTLVANHAAGAVDWIRKQNPVWRTVGRITFHLAENKRDEARPFAFMATYTDNVSSIAKPVQLPLAKALTEYASQNDRNALLRLLQPINTAAERCGWLKKMVDDQTVYQPRAWSPRQAYQLLQDILLLEESGLIVRVPDWWRGKHVSRPQVRINIGSQKGESKLSASSLLKFDIETVLNGERLTREDIAELLNADASLVRLNGQWVEVDREKLQSALDHWQKIDKLVKQDGLTFYEGMRMLSGLPVDGKWDGVKQELTFRDWSEVTPIGTLAETLAAIRDPNNCERQSFDNIGLNAVLRPYQEVGVRWLRLMTQLGLGACLADDMGLGKTIQVIALLLLMKNQEAAPQETTSLLVAPASLLGNWESEIKRFASKLKTVIAHSSGRGTSEPANLNDVDLVMTTYGMVERIEWMKSRRWRTIILDEAQAIKNAGAKQSRAVKVLQSGSRIAMTGTPIENRLSDLWSLFDFINPGLLGSNTAFAKFVKSFTKNQQSSEPFPQQSISYAPLRKLTQPYILRRLKTDKKIIPDLPDKTEVTAWCGLTKQQTVLYSQSVEQLAKELDTNSEGGSDIKRRGIILTYLMRFKQICNHPAQLTGDFNYDATLSGKFERITEICEEIASRQEKVLVFTQYETITQPLAEHLRKVFNRSGLILSGNVPTKKRTSLVEAFQSERGAPFFVLTVKSGGTGLNLTAASHVIHFDRWWNPAVENQATDRAFRIGQKKNVLVHKFVCRGTIEEKIDALIESKKSLANEVVEGDGKTEATITEMSNEEILKMVALDVGKV